MQYEHDFEYMLPEAFEGAAEGVFLGAAGIIMGVFLLIYFLALAFSVVSYVLNAVGLYRIAKRRGIHHAWLAWVPIGSYWLLGSISDHYQYVAKQKTTKRRKVLLILSLIMLGAMCLFSVGIAVTVISASGTAGEMGSILSVALSTIAYLAVMGMGIAVTVICYIAYYDLFQSSKPNNAVLFLVLSVIFNVTLPFFVFACSNADLGMPARRPQQREQILSEAPAPVAEEEEIPVVEAEVVEDPE